MCEIKRARKKAASVIYLNGRKENFVKSPLNLTSVPAPGTPKNAGAINHAYLYSQPTTTGMILVFTAMLLFYVTFFSAVEKLNRALEQQASTEREHAASVLRPA